MAKERPMLMQLTKKGSHSRNARAHAARHGLDEQTKNILNHFFCIIGNFFSILQDPHDKEQVTTNVSNILAGAVNIVAEGIKSGDLGLDANEQEIAAYVCTISKRLSQH
jgi:hypothetical protein